MVIVLLIAMISSPLQSNYGAGLRILHIDQKNYRLKEVAYFDCILTNRNTAEFEGTWSNYPYFESGKTQGHCNGRQMGDIA